ncbi:MAG: glycosyltransferase family 4 protein [Fibrobacteres bacterium]|nr:glycosyltransferase family 4 protein [Fibrobacterota bacterium]
MQRCTLERVRLAIVTQDFPPETGGIQTYVGCLAEHLHPLCEHLVVIAPDHPAAALVDPGLPFPVERIRIHSSWLVVGLLARIRRILRHHGATHVLYAQWFPGMAPTQNGIVRSTLVHGRELLRHPLGRFGLRYAAGTLKGMDLVLPNSRATAALLPHGIDPAKVRVVHPGVDLDRFRPPSTSEKLALRQRLGIAPDAPVVTTLARLVERKGIDTLLRCMAPLAQRIPGTRLLIGGTGPDRKRLESILRAENLGEGVRFCGKIPDEDLGSFLSLGVFALLSRQTARDVEGFGMVLAEAQACGAPVVAADSGGMPEAVGPGCGTIVAVDSITSTVDALARYLSVPAKLSQAGALGVGFAGTLSWESRAREIYQALEEATSCGPG